MKLLSSSQSIALGFSSPEKLELSKYTFSPFVANRSQRRYVSLRYSMETKLSPETVMKEALDYFEKLGLKVSRDEEDTLCLEGGGGHVTLTVCPGMRTSIEIETQEWDDVVKNFMLKIKR